MKMIFASLAISAVAANAYSTPQVITRPVSPGPISNIPSPVTNLPAAGNINVINQNSASVAINNAAIATVNANPVLVINQTSKLGNLNILNYREDKQLNPSPITNLDKLSPSGGRLVVLDAMNVSTIEDNTNLSAISSRLEK